MLFDHLGDSKALDDISSNSNYIHFRTLSKQQKSLAEFLWFIILKVSPREYSGAIQRSSVGDVAGDA